MEDKEKDINREDYILEDTSPKKGDPLYRKTKDLKINEEGLKEEEKSSWKLPSAWFIVIVVLFLIIIALVITLLCLYH